MTEEAPLLVIEGVSKRFGATQALSDVDLTLRSGEIHALVGENGAGKSTLIKLVTGIFPPDEGSIRLQGEAIAPRDTAEAQRLGIAAIYQEPSIFPDLSVAENIAMSHQGGGWRVDWSALYADAEKILATLDIDLDPKLPAAGLSVAGQQAVEIAKAISIDVRVLIMDEPTAALSAHEVDRLFRQMRRLRDAGIGILFVTHRLEEVFAIADRISVFRDGRHISTRPAGEVTEESLIREMVGRDPGEFFARGDHQPGEKLLSVSALGRLGVFSDVSFDLHRGEILGMAGLVGAGPHRRGTGSVRYCSGRCRGDLARRRNGRHPLTRGRPAPRDRLPVRGSTQAGPVDAPVGDGQYHDGDPAPVPHRVGVDRPVGRASGSGCAYATGWGSAPPASPHPCRASRGEISRRRCWPSGSTPGHGS